jgi:dipeptidyl aminopeptidase/acylaminoacyl peptidase
LIIHGREDRTVPPAQARAMIAALKKSGNNATSLFLGDEGHGLSNEKTRLAAFEAIATFLEKHLGEGVPHLGPEA